MQINFLLETWRRASDHGMLPEHGSAPLQRPAATSLQERIFEGT
jgi:hypothetical protein